MAADGQDTDEHKTKAISAGINDMALATIPGFYGLAGTAIGKPFGVHVWPDPRRPRASAHRPA